MEVKKLLILMLLLLPLQSRANVGISKSINIRDVGISMDKAIDRYEATIDSLEERIIELEQVQQSHTCPEPENQTNYLLIFGIFIAGSALMFFGSDKY
jgi:hypothetical protein